MHRALDPGVLEQFLVNALQGKNGPGEHYDNAADMSTEDGIHYCVLSKRFLDKSKQHSPIVTFVLVRTEEDDSFWRKTPCEPDFKWKFMEQVGREMWLFLVENIAHMQSESREVDTILTCTAETTILLLMNDGANFFLTGNCWESTVTDQGGFDWIHASMYSMAFRSMAQFPWYSMMQSSSKWDAEICGESKERMQGLELAFAMGMHHRLGENSLILKCFGHVIMHLLHDLSFRTSWKNVSSQDAKNVVVENSHFGEKLLY